MNGLLIGYTLLAVGTAAIVFVLTRRWETRFRKAVTAAYAASNSPEVETEGDSIYESGEPILVDPSALRLIVQDAVREALRANGAQPVS